MTRTNTDPSQPEEDVLPRWLERYTRYGLYGLVVGTVLGVLALFTNPVPDPSFPWFSLPAQLRLPITQPRIEHWPVSYTVAVWLWIAGVPALFFRGHARFRRRWRLGPGGWLLVLPTLSMFALTTYCRFFWPKLHPPTWNAPSYTFVCWLYCSSYDPLWSNLAYGVATVGLVASTLLVWRESLGVVVVVEAFFGVLALPLGLPAIYDAHRRYVGRE
ncbi:hypothetical protein [Halobaculum rarum]|uniref:hypothetical protein n=1 Tax=Halobaculum rarum TaxID=3075122 RepID=UPI0032AFAA81